MEKMFFCNIAWMKEYQGVTKDDIPIDGGGNPEKFEVCNFEKCKGVYYGYVQPPGPKRRTKRLVSGKDQRIAKIKNLGAEGDSAKDVTVVWTARDKKLGTVIVGWYEKAEVFQYYQKFSKHKIKPSNLQIKNNIDGFRIKAPAGKRLPVGARIYYPGEKSFRGYQYGNTDPLFSENVFEFIQFVNNRWGDGNKDVVKAVNEYLDIQKNNSLWVSNRRYGGTPEQRKEVEEAAIKMCRRHFRQSECKYEVCSFEKNNVGWDLGAWKPESQAVKDGKYQANKPNGVPLEDYLRDQYLRGLSQPDLMIEVKGTSTSRSDFSVVLTANEYTEFNGGDSNYRLAIVTNALKKNKELSICSYDKRQKCWRCQLVGSTEEYTLEIDEKMYAWIKPKS